MKWPPKGMEEMVGKWEGNCLRECPKYAYTYSLALKRIWRFWPRKTHPRLLRITDIEDYKAWRRERGTSWGTVKWELAALRHFITFLRRDLQMEIELTVIYPTRESWNEQHTKLDGRRNNGRRAED